MERCRLEDVGQEEDREERKDVRSKSYPHDDSLDISDYACSQGDVSIALGALYIPSAMKSLNFDIQTMICLRTTEP